jgi:YVTN family beta-propeller protein
VIKKLDAFCKSIPSLLVVMLVALLVSGTALGLETASAESMIKNINISNTPLGVADATNKDLGTVSVIDGLTNTVIKNIHVGSHPRGIAFDSDNGNLYVANEGSYTVSVIDSSTNEVIKNIIAGWSPLGVAFNPSNGLIYVTSGTVSVIDSSTNTVIDTIPMDERTSIPISVRLAS